MNLSRLRIVLPAVISCGAVLFAAGCDNSIRLTEVVPPLDAASLDANAGTWRMILLTAPTQFTVAAPAATNSVAYVAELNAIKTAQANLTGAHAHQSRIGAAGACCGGIR